MKENRFGSRLRQLRLEKELTHEEMGKLMGKSRSSIGHWENMKRSPDLNELLWLSDFFDVTVDYLLGNSDDRTCNIYEGEFNGHKVKIKYKPGEMDHEFTDADVVKVFEKLESIGIDVKTLLK